MGKYISDVIGDDYKSWIDENKIIISSPTGSGKTSFVWNVLFPYAKEQNKSIVYFCNRVLLKRQVIQNAEAIREEEIIISGKERGADIFFAQRPYIYIFSYQQFERWQYAKAPFHKEQIAFFVFDGAHYFLHDAFFNHNTDHWYYYFCNELLNKTCIAPEIFLSATPDELELFMRQWTTYVRFPQHLRIFYTEYRQKYDQILDDLKKAKMLREKIEQQHNAFSMLGNTLYYGGEYSISNYEQEEKELDSLNKEISDLEDKRKNCTPLKAFEEHLKELKSRYQASELEEKIKRYTMAEDYSNFIVQYFNDFEEIAHCIVNAAETNRWLIFVMNKAEGKELAFNINHSLRDENAAVFLDSTSKTKQSQDGRIFREIAETDQFSCRVLIATSVLDNGVNLKDDQLTNIVIDSIDRTSFLQMLGRKRYNEERTAVRLYIRHSPIKRILKLRNQYYNMYQDVINYLKLNTRGESKNRTDGKLSDWANHANKAAKKLQENIEKRKTVFHVKNQAYENGGKLTQPQSAKTLLGDLDYMGHLEIGTTAMLKLMNTYHSLEKEVVSYRETGDPDFFLKTQLQWIGKEYVAENWLDFRYDKIYDSLNVLVRSEAPIQCEELGLFTYHVLEYLCETRHKPRGYYAHRKQNQKKALQGNYPGVAAFNNGLISAGLPFYMEAIRKWNSELGKKMTVYYLRYAEQPVRKRKNNRVL